MDAALGDDSGEGTRAVALWLAANAVRLLNPDNKTSEYELVRRRRARKGPKPDKPDDEVIAHLLEQRIAGYSDLAGRGQMKNAVEDVIEQLGVTRTDVYAARKRRPQCKPPIPAPNVMRPLPAECPE
jgi:hypothetical protein